MDPGSRLIIDVFIYVVSLHIANGIHNRMIFNLLNQRPWILGSIIAMIINLSALIYLVIRVISFFKHP